MIARTVQPAELAPYAAVPRPAARPHAATLVACPAPPARGSNAPPESAIARVARAARQYDAHPVVVDTADESLELGDEDIVEVKVPGGAALSRIEAAIATATTDPVDAILGRTGALANARTTWQAADVVATALAKALGARAVVVHTMSADATQSRIIGVQGARTQDLLGSSEAGPDDYVLGMLRGTGKVATIRFQGKPPRSLPNRFRVVGASTAIVAFPVMIGSSWLGVIELVDPNGQVDGRVLRLGRELAARFGDYLSGRNAVAAA